MATGSHSLAVPVAWHAMPWHPSGMPCHAMVWPPPVGFSGSAWKALNGAHTSPTSPPGGDVNWRPCCCQGSLWTLMVPTPSHPFHRGMHSRDHFLKLVERIASLQLTLQPAIRIQQLTRYAYQSMYCQLLCGLVQNHEVLRVGAVFGSGFIRAIRFLKEHWRDLCNDIRRGTLNKEVTDPSVREVVMRLLYPNPKLAEAIQSECSKDSWQGIITRLWPNTKYIDVIVTGTKAQYIPTLEYYSGGLPLVCTMYASSECYFGLNLKPLCKPSKVSYTLLPSMAYFEFLPVHRNNGVTDALTIPVTFNEKEQQDLIELVDVKLGQEYELVLTTYAGLYRCRVGDVLPVAGFYNVTPQFHFVCRKNDCCLTIEESVNSVYRQGRVADKSIGPLEIRVVESGTFDKLMDYALSRGASINQYKAPRCVKFTPILELLNSRVIDSYFSPKCPKWAPGRQQWAVENYN
eukprot:Gb_17400 [translate_table: standard]